MLNDNGFVRFAFVFVLLSEIELRENLPNVLRNPLEHDVRRGKVPDGLLPRHVHVFQRPGSARRFDIAVVFGALFGVGDGTKESFEREVHVVIVTGKDVRVAEFSLERR